LRVNTLNFVSQSLTERWGIFVCGDTKKVVDRTGGILSGNSYYIGGAKSRQISKPLTGGLPLVTKCG